MRLPLSMATTFLVTALLGACGTSAAGSNGRLEVVGSFYPLAWVARQIGGARADVIDLTPPGVEAHDTNLSAKQVAQVERADVVLILGDLGFQPQVEDAAGMSSARVVEVTAGIQLLPSEERGLSADPHVWLDPMLMEDIVHTVSEAMVAADPAGAATYAPAAQGLIERLDELDAAYRAGVRGCRFSTFVTTHEAFGYLAAEYGLHQIGIEGLTPEAEPSADQLVAARQAIQEGRAAPAVFYEGTDEGKRIGETVAASVGVPALPLSTLEFDPAPADYLSVMQANLTTLHRGLQCP